MTSKLFLLFFFVSIAIIILVINNRSVAQSAFTYLALGDSYTVGEGVAVSDTFSYQAVQLLRRSGYHCSAPEIIAQTGWTAAELREGIRNTHLLPSYQFVSLLVGVNDQYRGLDPEAYRQTFEAILKQAILLTGDRKNRVFILSIPDWSATPFAEGKDRETISAHIDRFNQMNEEVARQYGVAYLNITPGTRQAGSNPRLLTADGLHYARKEYANWAVLLAESMMQVFV